MNGETTARDVAKDIAYDVGKWTEESEPEFIADAAFVVEVDDKLWQVTVTARDGTS